MKASDFFRSGLILLALLGLSATQTWATSTQAHSFRLQRVVENDRVHYQVMVQKGDQTEQLLFTRMSHTLKEDEEAGGLRKYYRIRKACLKGKDLGLIFETATGTRYEIFEELEDTGWVFRNGYGISGAAMGYLPPGVYNRIEKLTFEGPFLLVVHRRAYRTDERGSKPMKKQFQEIFRFNAATKSFVRSVRRNTEKTQ